MASTTLSPRAGSYLRVVFLANGVADLLVAAMLIVFPAAGRGIPGIGTLGSGAAFAAGGWGVAALALGVTRLWAAARPGPRRFMALVGLLEGCCLAFYSAGRVASGSVTLGQARLALTFGILFGVAYAIGLVAAREE